MLSLFRLVLVLMILVSGSSMALAQSQCKPFPKLAWWKNLSHESVISRVNTSHEGNWSEYISKWENQLTYVKDTYLRGGKMVVTKKKILLQGNQLKEYVRRITVRVSVTKCLANESRVKN